VLAVRGSARRWAEGAHHTLSLIVSDYYDNAHFLITLGVAVWLW
jgi:hypothetical protein